jgi:hypothetical protein
MQGYPSYEMVGGGGMVSKNVKQRKTKYLGSVYRKCRAGRTADLCVRNEMGT